MGHDEMAYKLAQDEGGLTPLQAIAQSFDDGLSDVEARKKYRQIHPGMFGDAVEAAVAEALDKGGDTTVSDCVCRHYERIAYLRILDHRDRVEYPAQRLLALLKEELAEKGGEFKTIADRISDDLLETL